MRHLGDAPDESRRPPTIPLALLAPLIVAMLGLSGCGGDSVDDPPASGEPVSETDENGSTKTVAVDPETGLEFSVYFSGFGESSTMQVTLTDSTTDEARDAVVGSPVAIYCDVPDQDVQYFPQEWKEGEESVGSALLPDEPELNVAAEAESCALALGDPEDPEVFDDDPFAEVDLR